MEPVAKSDFIAWKDNYVTKVFLSDVISLIEGLVSNLVDNAGKDAREDGYMAGRIRGLTELADWKPSALLEKE